MTRYEGLSMFSMIVPTRGRERNLLYLLIDVMHSTPDTGGVAKGLEVIVVDAPPYANESDATFGMKQWNVGNRFSSDLFPSLHYIRQTEGRYATALNLGAKAASNEVLFFVDADVRLPKGVVTDMLVALDGADIVCAPRRHVQIGLSPFVEWGAPRARFTCTWASMMRRETLQEMGGFQETTLTDVDFWLKAQRRGLKVAYTQKSVVLTRKVRHEVRKMLYFARRIVEEDMPLFGLTPPPRPARSTAAPGSEERQA